MSKIIILPHIYYCPNGFIIKNFNFGESLCNILLKNKIYIEHSCGKVCACTTCHVIVCKGFNLLNKPSLKEENLLDIAWGLEANSRLSCQVILKKQNLIIKIPQYTINYCK
ncbi:ISC system 2Fe-2S type ferredoxin [Candidatus Zinderia endosymbiont of Aphrophora alni]|uniref:ISC system 2Fe-2S type ferredoxin n=1 Tax=Candidatus Zinderia endosymbiont of Aphrophora alni TaxID=3077951 RepID=UPI0030CC96FA